MLKAILAKGFKGLSFKQPLEQFNLFLGNNGAGKSARSQALTLAIMGYLPSDGKKKPGDIFQIHSHNGESFSVGFEIVVDTVSQTFSRTFKNGNGVSQDVACNKTKLKQTEIEKVLFQLGDPRIFDLKEFVELSDQKKIDLIFSLFPPEKDLGNLDEELEAISEKEKPISQQVKALELTISNLTKAKSDIAIPAGTLAEVQKEIIDKEAVLKEAEKELHEIETKEREEKVKADAEAKAKQRELDLKKQAEKEKETAVEAAKEKGREEGKAEAKIEAQVATGPATREESLGGLREQGILPGDFEMVNAGAVRNALESILAIMQKAGCSACAATIKVKILLKEYSGKEVA